MIQRFSKIAGLVFLTLSVVCSFYGQGAAQGRITHTIEKEAQSAPNLGRDLWFCIPQNFDRLLDNTRYFYIYISSPKNTTAYIQVGNNPILTRPITANQTTVLSSLSNDFPKSAEVQSSDLIEPNKAIHVWSKDAELSVYLLSRAPFTTDGMYVIPTIGWGTEYIVASYNSFIIEAKYANLPSEFCIIANQDNTFVTITPTYDIAQDGFPNVVAHPKGQQFGIILNKGQCVQYQTAVPPSDVSDLTGTRVVSDKPIGLIGASVCPNITVSDNTCDHVLEMIPPVRVWSNTYFTAPFSGRKYGGDGFLVIGTKAGQVINRNGAQAALLTNKYDFQFLYDINNASQWTSDTSFLVVQYVMSASHGAPSSSSRNTGDPAMVVINPAEQFGKKIIFQIPTQILASNQANFVNYLDIIVPTSHESKTTMDGKSLNAVPNTQSFLRYPIPNTQWEAIRLQFKPNAGEGNHVLVSDTTIGLYLYGYTNDDSYAWSGALGVKSPSSKDTIPPLPDTTGLCFCSHISTKDVHPFASKLNYLSVDTSYNVLYYPNTSFIDGAGTDSSYYDICVIDSSKEAYIEVSIYDIAGNRTTVKSTYKPSLVQFAPNPLNFGGGAVGVTQYLYDTLFNPGQFPFFFKNSNFTLINGTKGFVIDSAGADGPIPPGGFRIVKIRFTPAIPATVKDTMQISDNCSVYKCPLIGNGGAADFVVSDYEFECTKPNTTETTVGYLVVNNSPTQVKIDSIWVDDPIHFGYNSTTPAQNVLPFIVPKSNVLSGTHEVFFTFTPTAVGPIQTVAHFLSKGAVGERTAILRGSGCAPLITSTPKTNNTECKNPITVSIPFVNVGSASDSIVRVSASDTIRFKNLFIQNGLGVNIPTPFGFDTGRTIYADVTFTPPTNLPTGCYDDSVVLHSDNGGVWIGKVTVCYSNRTLVVQTGNVSFGAVAFGSPKQQKTFRFCNPKSKDTLTVYRFDVGPSRDSGAFRLTGQVVVNGSNISIPPAYKLAPGDCMDVYVEFDPAFALDTGQEGSFIVVSNDCDFQNQPFGCRGNTLTGQPSIQGFDAPVQFSCAVYTDSIQVTNSTLAGVKRISGITISGPDAVNFASVKVPPIALPAQSVVKIPIDFRPTSGVANRSYNASVDVEINDGGVLSTLKAPVTGASQGYDLSINTAFTKTGVKAGDKTAMVVNLAVDKHGLTVPIDVLDIRKVVLKYTYDINMLDIDNNNIVAAFTSSIPGWTVDAANSSVDIPTQTLTLTLIGTTPISDASTSLGFLNFTATLPKTGSGTPVTLTSDSLFNGAGSKVPSCLGVGHIDTSITLVYQCGDSALIHYMNGDPLAGRIIPVSPNPVRSTDNSTVSFRYAIRHEGNVSLSIFDALGREIDRIENGVRHPAGTFEVFYDTRKLSGGSYVFRFTFDEKLVQSGRLVIDR